MEPPTRLHSLASIPLWTAVRAGGIVHGAHLTVQRQIRRNQLQQRLPHVLL